MMVELHLMHRCVSSRSESIIVVWLIGLVFLILVGVLVFVVVVEDVEGAMVGVVVAAEVTEAMVGVVVESVMKVEAAVVLVEALVTVVVMVEVVVSVSVDVVFVGETCRKRIEFVSVKTK